MAKKTRTAAPRQTNLSRLGLSGRSSRRDVIAVMTGMVPQAYGFVWQAYIASKAGHTIAKGYTISPNGDTFEHKISLLNAKSFRVNQVRAWDHVGYALTDHDPTSGRVQHFFLTPKQMVKEIVTSVVARPTHHLPGYRARDHATLIQDRAAHFSITMTRDEDIYNRWVSKYGVSFSDMIAKLK